MYTNVKRFVRLKVRKTVLKEKKTKINTALKITNMKTLTSLFAAYFLLASVNAATLNVNPFAAGKMNNAMRIENKGLTIVPNAKTGDVQVVFNTVKAGKATITIVNQDGKTVLTQKVELTAGKNNINVNNFSELEEGNYTVTLTSTEGNFSSPFLLWK